MRLDIAVSQIYLLIMFKSTKYVLIFFLSLKLKKETGWIVLW